MDSGLARRRHRKRKGSTFREDRHDGKAGAVIPVDGVLEESGRQAAAFLQTPEAVKKLFDKLGTRFGQRNGGYTRVVRIGSKTGSAVARKGDGAEMAMLELVGSELVKRAAERAKRREERLKQMQQGQHEGEGGEPAAE